VIVAVVVRQAGPARRVVVGFARAIERVRRGGDAMRNLLMSLVVMSGAVVALPAVSAEPTTAEALAWIAGDREQREGDTVARELWIGPSGGMLLGMSLTTRPGKSAAYEHLRIGPDSDGTLAYFSIPSGQQPTTFRLLELTPGRVVFENPAHDFPQRVIYTDLGEGRIGARIEGQIDGKTRSSEWTFTPRRR
jgi:hypothetical protein